MNCVLVLEKDINKILKLDLSECKIYRIKNGTTFFSICCKNEDKIKQTRSMVNEVEINFITKEYEIDNIKIEKLRSKYGS